jgi:hypothetical protein
MGFTDNCYTDGRVPSVSPSVWFSPTDVIAVTDGISPSVKLDNVVVIVIVVVIIIIIPIILLIMIIIKIK